MEPLPQPAPLRSSNCPLPEAEADGKSLFRELIEDHPAGDGHLPGRQRHHRGRFRIEGAACGPTCRRQYVIVNRLAYAEVGPANFGRPQRAMWSSSATRWTPSRDLHQARDRPAGRARGNHRRRRQDLPGAGRRRRSVRDAGRAVHPGDLEPAPRHLDARPNEYFVMGDNAQLQHSHNWGPLNGDAIIGKAWVITGLPSNWGTVPH